MGNAVIFATWFEYNQTFKFEPNIAGGFIIKLALYDDNYNSLSTQYQISINITSNTPPKEYISKDDENSKENSTKAFIRHKQFGQSLEEELSCRVYNIDEKGFMIIIFNENLD